MQALLHPQGHSSVRTISRLRLPESHFLSPFLYFSPSLSQLCLYSDSHNAYTVRQDRLCPHSVPTIHSPSALIAALQTSFISYSSALAHYTFYSHPTSSFTMLMAICIHQVLLSGRLFFFYYQSSVLWKIQFEGTEQHRQQLVYKRL